MMSLIAVPYQDNDCDSGVFVCRYAYNLYMMRHQKFTYCDYFESPPFTSKITRGLVFQFDVSDIDRIREEIATLIDNLSKLYQPRLDEQNEAARKAKRIAKQKDPSKNVNDDADKSSSKGEGKVEGDLAGASVEKEGNGRVMMPSSFEHKDNISQESGSQNCVFNASAAGVAGDRVAVSSPAVAGGAVASFPGQTREGVVSPPTPAPQSSTTTIVSLADFARDVIARTGGGLLVASNAPEVEEMCGFLVAKYAVADIAIPARMSPSATVDAVWHRLMLYPRAYDATCRRAYELAAVIVGGGDGNFAYDEFPGVVDHSPNAASDPPSAKEQRCRAAVFEMRRLGLSPSTTAADPAHPARSRANVCTPPAARSSKRARLTNGRGLGRNTAEEEEEAREEEAVEAVEEEAEEDEAREDEADEEDAEEEDVNGNAEHAGETATIRVKDLTGERNNVQN